MVLYLRIPVVCGGGVRGLSRMFITMSIHFEGITNFIWYTGWWFGTCLMNFHILGIVIVPTDFHIFHRGWLNHQPVYGRIRSYILMSPAVGFDCTVSKSHGLSVSPWRIAIWPVCPPLFWAPLYILITKSKLVMSVMSSFLMIWIIPWFSEWRFVSRGPAASHRRRLAPGNVLGATLARVGSHLGSGDGCRSHWSRYGQIVQWIIRWSSG